MHSSGIGDLQRPAPTSFHVPGINVAMYAFNQPVPPLFGNQVFDKAFFDLIKMAMDGQNIGLALVTESQLRNIATSFDSDAVILTIKQKVCWAPESDE